MRERKKEGERKGGKEDPFVERAGEEAGRRVSVAGGHREDEAGTPRRRVAATAASARLAQRNLQQKISFPDKNTWIRERIIT